MGAYNVWNHNLSEHRRFFVGKDAGGYRFVYMLVKTNDEKIRARGSQFKAVCANLGIDPIIPLIVVWGIFCPRDEVRFTSDLNVRRNRADNTLLLGVPDDIILADAKYYNWTNPVHLTSPSGTDSWYLEEATIKLRSLTDITSTHRIDDLVEDLLQMQPLRLSGELPKIPPAASAYS